jgi:hypothetical protein
MRVPADARASDASDARRRWAANLVDDRPPRLARVLSSHPPVRDRVLAAIRAAAASTRP